MPSEKQWIKTSHNKLEPQRGRITPSRPKKQRRRTPDKCRDPKNPNWMRKFGARVKYGKCHGFGHNKRSCPMNRSEASNVNFSLIEVSCSTKINVL
jgi:hypothetical protein